MNEIELVLNRLTQVEANYRQDSQLIFAELKAYREAVESHREADKAASHAQREADKAAVLSQLTTLFKEGCANAPLHKETMALVKIHGEDIKGIAEIIARIKGVMWVIGVASPILSFVAPIVVSHLAKGKP